MSRASYARARRARKETPQESKLRPVLEKVAKKVVNTKNIGVDFKDPDNKTYGKGGVPVVNRAVQAAGKGVQNYLKGTEAVAEKLKPILKKLPKPPQKHRRMPARRPMKRM